MRTYIFNWEESTNTIILEPTTCNKGGKTYRLSKKNVCTFVLKTEEKEIVTSLDGCIEYLNEELEKGDFIALATFLYSWGQYNGARMN